MARFSGQALGRLFFNQVPTPGSRCLSSRGAQRSGAGALTRSPSPTHPLHRRPGRHLCRDRPAADAVASAPATGQYTFSRTGVYTFAAGDAGARRPDLLLLHRAPTTTTRASPSPIPLIGPTSTFSANLFATDPDNAQFSVTLYHCVASKFSFDTKIEDFTMPEFDFQASPTRRVRSAFNFGDAA